MADPVIAQAQLQAWLAKWQKLLRLQDWDVKIEFARGFKLDNNKQGLVSWIKSQKAALIKIIDPGDYDSDIGAPNDVEQCVVHELVHLHFATFDDTRDLRETLLEQAVDSIAWALVKCDRANTTAA